MKTVINHGEKQTVIALEDGNLITGTIQDCTPHIEYLKDLRAAGVTGSSEMRFAGSIPDVVVEKYCNENGVSFQEFLRDRVHVKRILNNPEFKDLRVWEGRI